MNTLDALVEEAAAARGLTVQLAAAAEPTKQDRPKFVTNSAERRRQEREQRNAEALKTAINGVETALVQAFADFGAAVAVCMLLDQLMTDSRDVWFDVLARSNSQSVEFKDYLRGKNIRLGSPDRLHNLYKMHLQGVI